MTEKETERRFAARERIVAIVSEVLEIPVSKDAVMTDIAGWDSLKTLQIVMALDEAGYSVPLEKIAELRSVGDILSAARGP
ncbi:MAG: acyl carrier protein [Synergistaceae bacterium]|jgi:acyl carrier protein|nr:acyl carrier protein [Synergistaceae bacterium]